MSRICKISRIYTILQDEVAGAPAPFWQATRHPTHEQDLQDFHDLHDFGESRIPRFLVACQNGAGALDT